MNDIDNLQDGDAFILSIIKEFPEIEKELLDEDFLGILTLQLGIFKRFTQNAIDSKDNVTLKRCFSFVNENFDKVTFKVENSLVLSYLGKLSFDRNPNARKLLPKKLEKLVRELGQVQHSKNDEVNSFLKKNGYK